MPFYTENGITADARGFFDSIPVTTSNLAGGANITKTATSSSLSKIDITTWIIISLSIIFATIFIFFYLDNLRIDKTGAIEIYQIIHDNTRTQTQEHQLIHKTIRHR